MNKNSLGWMEFRIHPYNKDIKQEDLNSYLLGIGGTRTTRYRVNRSGYHVIPVKLPENLECDRCLLQWKYHTGSLWGCAESNGTECCYGCRQEQEEFYNCADVSVTPATGKKDEQFKKRQQYEELKFRRIPPAARSAYLRWWCLTQCEGEECSTAPCSRISRQRRSTSNCFAAGAWRGLSNMDTWCQNNCGIGYCPASHCQCQDLIPATITTSRTTPQTAPASTTALATDHTSTHAHTTTTNTSHDENAPGIVRVLVSKGCEYCKERKEENCADLYCPGYNAVNVEITGTLTQKIRELSSYFCTTCDSNDSICQKLFCSSENMMISLGLHTKCRICQLTGSCQEYPECNQINRVDTTSSTVTTRPTTTTVPAKRKCLAINYYAQIIGMNQWCEDNCGSSTDGSCYPDVCRCSDPFMPLIQKLDTDDITTCKAIGVVANIPGMDKWCMDNCPNNCPETYCSCSVQPVTQATTTTTEKTTTSSTTTEKTTSPTTTEKTTTSSTIDPLTASSEATGRTTTLADIVSGTTTVAGVTTLPPQTTATSKGVDYYSINSMNGILCNICRSDPAHYRSCSDFFCARFDENVGEPQDRLERALSYSPELFCGIKNKDAIFCEPAPMIRPFIQSCMCSVCISLTPDQNCHTYCRSS